VLISETSTILIIIFIMSAPSLTIGATVFEDFMDQSVPQSVTGWGVVKFLENATIKKYTDSSAFVAISDVRIECNGSSISCLAPDDWGTPTATTTTTVAMSGLPTCMTTAYNKDATLPWIAYLTPQLFPKVLVGSPPIVWIFTGSAQTVIIHYKLWRKGFKPIKPTFA
jgi:hypothetical protein